MTAEYYTEADVARVTRLIVNPSDVLPFPERDSFPTWAARAILADLAAAGRLLPEGAKTEEEWRFELKHLATGFADYYPNAGLAVLTGPNEQAVRDLAAPYVTDPEFAVAFERRLTSATDWLPVDAALQGRSEPSDG